VRWDGGGVAQQVGELAHAGAALALILAVGGDRECLAGVLLM